MQSGNKVASIDTKTGAIKEYPRRADRTGSRSTRPATSGSAAWATTRWASSTPQTGQMSEVDTGRGSRPRRVAAAPDGMLWITYYGNGMLAKLDPPR